MPYQLVESEVLTEYRGVTVYHTYRNESLNDPYEYWYSFSQDELVDHPFDVRSFSGSKEKTHEMIIKEAIDLGLLADKVFMAEEAAGEVMIEPIEWPENWQRLEHHLLALLMDHYNDYIDTANEEDKYSSGWRPVTIQEFYTNEFVNDFTEEFLFDYDTARKEIA